MTQLKQNTADLDALIAKANALPDVGGGGGDGAVETCTVTVTAPSFAINTIYYINGSLELTEQSVGTGGKNEDTITITIIKHSFLCTDGGYDSISGDCQRPYRNVLYVYGDATVMLEGM